MQALTPTPAYSSRPAPRGEITSIIWTVPSATTKGISYEVKASVVDGRLECTCAARKCCWHVKSVASGQAGKPRVRYTPAPPLKAVPSAAGRRLQAGMEV